MPARPKTLDVLTIAPLPCSSSTGRNARTPWTTPSKLIECSHSSSSGEASATLEVSATPALLNTAPIGAGAHSRTAAANASWPWRSRTSSGRGSDGPASRPAVSSRPRSSASAMATGHPCRERRTARARPIPEAAPVITAVRPASGGTVVRATVLDSTKARCRLARRYLERSMGTVQERPKSDFRARLLAGLAESVREKGLQGTQISDIVRHARTSRRTFYECFPDKESCFVELVELSLEAILEEVGATVHPEAPGREQVDQAVDSCLGALGREPSLTVTISRELPT